MTDVGPHPYPSGELALRAIATAIAWLAHPDTMQVSGQGVFVDAGQDKESRERPPGDALRIARG